MRRAQTNRLARRSALALILAIGIGSAGVRGQDASTVPALGASALSLIEHARQGNPGFAAARAEAAAAHERVTPAGALPDPRFELELMDATNTMSGRSASLLPGQVGETRYRIVQPLPGWGKRELAVQAAAAQATQTDAMRDAAWTELAAKIEALWLRYYAADREQVLNREALTLLQSLEEVSLTRYELGLLPQQAVLRMQREITTQRLALVEIEQRRKGVAAGLNGLLGRAHDAPLAPPDDPDPLPDRLEAATLFEAAASANPEVQVAANGIDVARAERAHLPGSPARLRGGRDQQPPRRGQGIVGRDVRSDDPAAAIQPPRQGARGRIPAAGGRGPARGRQGTRHR